MSVFDKYAAYYDLLYQDKSYQEEVNYLDSLIKKYKCNSQRILDLGCGTGKHANQLAEKGYLVDGIDISETMIETAKNGNYKNCSFSTGDIRSFQNDKKYDVVTSLFHVICYQNSNSDLLNSFKTAAKHIVDGGLFIFDFWYGPAVLNDKPSVRIKRMANDNFNITRIAEPIIDYNKNVVKVNFEVIIENKATKQVETIKESHNMRYLFLPEIELLLEQAGMKLMNSLQWMSDCAVLNEDNWYGVVICQKDL